jgi:hypothetical protein
MSHKHQLLLAFYGDDFTGSTDALEFLSRAGIKTVLFMEPPTAAQLDNYEGLQAIGVAGLTRSMKPADMEATLRPAFTALKQLGAPHGITRFAPRSILRPLLAVLAALWILGQRCLKRHLYHCW